MKVILFGATGMIGSGVLKACLDDPSISAVLSIGRSPSGQSHPKLKELIHQDFFNYASIESELRGYEACFFPLGVTSVGKNEAEYSRLTYDLTLAAAETLLRLNPGMSFCYVSGQATDSTEKGRIMWARVKGRTENKLLSMDFRPTTVFRPGAVIPMKGVRSKTAWYNLFYTLTSPILPLLRSLFPNTVLTSQGMGRAMIKAARGESEKRILEPADINRLGG